MGKRKKGAMLAWSRWSMTDANHQWSAFWEVEGCYATTGEGKMGHIPSAYWSEKDLTMGGQGGGTHTTVREQPNPSQWGRTAMDWKLSMNHVSEHIDGWYTTEWKNINTFIIKKGFSNVKSSFMRGIVFIHHLPLLCFLSVTFLPTPSPVLVSFSPPPSF